MGGRGFFRDGATWRLLEDVSAGIVAAKAPGEPVRIWIPGCGSGEDAYAVGMLVSEALQVARKSCPLKIFATDLDLDAIGVARAGVYPDRIATQLTPGRLQRFFVAGQSTYRVIPELRACMVFGRQHLLTDPPLSRIDFIFCGDPLVHLEPAAKRKAVALLRHALRPGGYLWSSDGEMIPDETRARRHGSPGDEASPRPTGPRAAELRATREQLRRIIARLETTNEELRAANEEAIAANEGLLASKGELESLNAELRAVNDHLRAKHDELERTTDDLDNLLASTNLATIFLDEQFRIRRFTPAATRLFALTAADVGRPLDDVASQFADRDLLRDAGTVLDTLAPIRKEVRTRDGRWYMREVLLYRTREKRIGGVVITFSDTADQVLQEARLRAEAIVDTVHESLLVLDAPLRVVSANRAFYETFRCSPEETERRPFFELGGGHWNVPALRAAIGDVVPDGTPVAALELRREFARLGERTMLLHARPLARGAERPDQILLAIDDVSDRKQAEAELRRHEAELARVLRVTLTGELAAGLAHELNQPLAAIANTLEACTTRLRSGPTSPKTLLPLLRDATAQSVRVGRIMRDVRDLVRRQQPHRERTDLRRLIESAGSLLGGRAAEHAIDVTLALGEVPLPVHVSRIEIEQVVLNLMHNGIDAIRLHGGRERQLTVQAASNGDGTVEVSVVDSGPGISDAIARSMFEPFFTTKLDGLGMGLAICRSIVEAHGGRLWTTPVAGGTGARLRFTLPCDPASSRRRPAGQGRRP